MQEMHQDEILERYSIINEKNKREIVLLRGSGCSWKKCTFCDYHYDFSSKKEENIALNSKELKKITGIYSKLEVINSGSFSELPPETIKEIENICLAKDIKTIHFESHFSQRSKIEPLKKYFKRIGIEAIFKIGIETFDYDFRESILKKGIPSKKAEHIAQYFDECCLLQGIYGQTKQSMINDIETALKHFQRVCVNIMQENGMSIKPDPRVIEIFVKEIYPIYKDNQRIDILLNNTDFGVGDTSTQKNDRQTNDK